MSEAFAGLGIDVTGIDPSPVLLETAREHADENSLVITYLKGISPGKNLVSGLLTIVKRARGKISRYEMGRRLNLSESDDTRVQYLGFAVKA